MKVVIGILMLTFVAACKQEDDAAKPNEYAAKYVREFNQVDSFFVPSNKRDSLTNLEKWLGLKSIRKGADSIHIRFVYEVYLLPEFVMAELIHDGKKWRAEISRITQHYNEEKEKVDTMTRVMKLDNPKSSWIKFINQLFDLKALIIQDFSSIPREDQVLPNDGDIIAMEVATSGSYHSYAYPCADMQKKKYWQVVSINKIKELLYDEFKMLDRFDKAIEVDFWKGVKERRREMEKKGKKSRGKVKMQEMNVQEVNIADTAIPNKKP